jgi:surface antigen
LIQVKAPGFSLLFLCRREHRLSSPVFADAMVSKEQNMSLSAKVLIPVVVGLVAASAQAQLLPTWETHITLTQQDLDMIRGAVTNQVHGKPVGTTATWSNPTSGNSGSIKLLKKLPRTNQQCEQIEYTVRSGGTPVYTEHYHFTSCPQPDGTWKIAQY